MVRETIWPQSAPKADPVNVVQILLQDGEASLKLSQLLVYNIMDTRPLLEPACSFLNIWSTVCETLCRGWWPLFHRQGPRGRCSSSCHTGTLGILMILPLFQTRRLSLSSLQIIVKNGRKCSNVMDGFTLKTCAPRLSCPPFCNVESRV